LCCCRSIYVCTYRCHHCNYSEYWKKSQSQTCSVASRFEKSACSSEDTELTRLLMTFTFLPKDFRMLLDLTFEIAIASNDEIFIVFVLALQCTRAYGVISLTNDLLCFSSTLYWRTIFVFSFYSKHMLLATTGFQSPLSRLHHFV
jgi:hypothetical protein